MRKKKQPPFAIILSIAAVVLSAYAVFTVNEMKTGGVDDDSFKSNIYEVIDSYVAEKSGQAPPSSGESVEVSVDDDAMKGDVKAPVTIIEFSDYECPFCKRHFEETYPQIMEKYVDTGKVNYVFRDFPLGFHAKAKPAANAAECIREQGGDEMYFEYHDVLFNNQSAMSIDDLKGYAAEFDIDQAQFDSCVDEGKYNSEVDKDIADGMKYGVRGTPAFFINGAVLSGAQPFSAFEAVIESELDNLK